MDTELDDKSMAQILDLYKDLHRNPELSFAEHRTARTVAESLTRSGYEVTTGIGRTGGSNMWAVRSRDRRSATLFNGPQLGFQIPELFVEMELHRPGLDARGATAPGVPVLGLGHNEHVAWGVTSGLTDDDVGVRQTYSMGAPRRSASQVLASSAMFIIVVNTLVAAGVTAFVLWPAGGWFAAAGAAVVGVLHFAAWIWLGWRACRPARPPSGAARRWCACT